MLPHGYYVGGTLVGFPAQGGGRECELNAAQLAEFIADPEAYAANYFGLTRAQFREWLESEGRMQCSALTTLGRRCRNFVSGRMQLDSDAWRRLEGEYCVIHGGRPAEGESDASSNQAAR